MVGGNSRWHANMSGFAKFTMPSSLIGNIAMQMPIYALASIGATSSIGLFSRGRQLLTMPITMLGYSTGSVLCNERLRSSNQRAVAGEYSLGHFLRSRHWQLLPTLLLAYSHRGCSRLSWRKLARCRGNCPHPRTDANVAFCRQSVEQHFCVAGAQREGFYLMVATISLNVLLVAIPA